MNRLDPRSVLFGVILAIAFAALIAAASPSGPFDETGRFQHQVTMVKDNGMVMSVCDTRTGTVHWLSEGIVITNENGNGSKARIAKNGGLWLTGRSTTPGGFIEFTD